MRVTNEQAISTSKADYVTGKNLSDTLKAYAKDLLEARAMIREMLSGFEQISAIGNDRNIFDSKARRDSIYVADTMLEKSKEFADE
jgi:hypothetical protein